LVPGVPPCIDHVLAGIFHGQTKICPWLNHGRFLCHGPGTSPGRLSHSETGVSNKEQRESQAGKRRRWERQAVGRTLNETKRNGAWSFNSYRISLPASNWRIAWWKHRRRRVRRAQNDRTRVRGALKRLSARTQELQSDESGEGCDFHHVWLVEVERKESAELEAVYVDRRLNRTGHEWECFTAGPGVKPPLVEPSETINREPSKRQGRKRESERR
jgi:hypothetical protein